MTQPRHPQSAPGTTPKAQVSPSPDDTDTLDPGLLATRIESDADDAEVMEGERSGERRPASTGAKSGDSAQTSGDKSAGSSKPGSRASAKAGSGTASAGGSEASSGTGSKAGSKGGTKSGTSFDTLVGQLVIERGFATPEEVKHCRTLAASNEDPAERSLSHLLVQNEYVTSRQVDRLRQIIDEERSGQQIPGFKVESKLGAGAMAKVFLARQVSLDRKVAIKVLPKKFSSNPQFIERFYNEGRAAAQLNHPNIVQAFDVGRAGDLYYFVMEYVEGRTVHDDIVEKKRFDERTAIDIVIKVAEALHHAHEQGLIHRDVKPKNIMLANNGLVKLADMGLARAITDKEAAEAEAGKAFGTPYYISPEQIRGEKDIGAPADIYSLGATLYHMVTGQVPFEGKNPSSVMSKHLKTPVVPPDHVNAKLSNGIGEVIEMMMAKKVRERYQTCEDLLIDLRAVLNGEQPPLAHKDVMAHADLAEIASAEAAIGAEDIVEDRSGTPGLTLGQQVQAPMFVFLSVLFGLSVIGNLILLLTR
ncbi:MAG: protein kinase [Planctomycetota bacterium]